MSSKIIHRRTSNVASALAYLKEMYKEYFQHGAEEEQGLVLFTKQFEPIVKLRLLQLRDVKLEGNFRHLPPEIKWLQWKKCPLKCLPSDLPPKLTVLDLSESKIERVWGSRQWCWYNNKVGFTFVVKVFLLTFFHFLVKVYFFGNRLTVRNVLFTRWQRTWWF